METKICSKCHIEKDIFCFGKDKRTSSGYRYNCNDCRKIESKFYRQNNSEKRKESVKKYYRNNVEKEKKRQLIYKEKNYEKLKEIKRLSYHKNKHKHTERIKIYLLNNRERRRNYQKNKVRNDVLYRLCTLYRTRIYNFLSKKNITKKNSTTELVGCSKIELKKYIESFFDNGMSWDNYGEWHIDHIIPLSSAENEEDVYKLCHYTNLQPLWAKDNLSKSNKIV